MERGNLSRRGFLQRSLTGLAAVGVPAWFGREVLAAQEQAAAANRRTAANDRVLVGAIGIGSPQSRGLQLLNDAKRHKAIQYVACCDVDSKHVDRAAKSISDTYGSECAKYKDFRELLDRKDLNAVVIAVPDHWHTLVAIEAMRKGKDVYCEKPLTLTVDEGKALVKVARQTERVLQTGSQQRSEYRGMFRLACELVRNGRVGKLQSIETRIGGLDKNKVGPFKTAPVPAGLDWDFWQGQTGPVEYIPERCHYEFRWWYEYSGGKMTDWGAHHNDIAQWALDMDNSGPVAVEAEGEASKQPNCYNVHHTFKVTYTYANGVPVVCTSGGENGVRFNGANGQWIFVSRGVLRASDKKLIDEPLPATAVRLYESTNHMGNWLDCMRSRKRPVCDVEIGHRSVTVCHLGAVALRSGKKLKWDPAKEEFVDDAEANKWLRREMRAPWKIDV